MSRFDTRWNHFETSIWTFRPVPRVAAWVCSFTSVGNTPCLRSRVRATFGESASTSPESAFPPASNPSYLNTGMVSPSDLEGLVARGDEDLVEGGDALQRLSN